MPIVGEGYKIFIEKIREKIPLPKKRAKDILKILIPLYRQVNIQNEQFIKEIVDFYKEREDFDPYNLYLKHTWLLTQNGKLKPTCIENWMAKYPLLILEQDRSEQERLAYYNVAFYLVVLCREKEDAEKIYEYLVSPEVRPSYVEMDGLEYLLNDIITKKEVSFAPHKALVRSKIGFEGEDLTIAHFKEQIVAIEKEIQNLLTDKNKYTLMYFPSVSREMTNQSNYLYNELAKPALYSLLDKKEEG